MTIRWRLLMHESQIPTPHIVNAIRELETCPDENEIIDALRENNCHYAILQRARTSWESMDAYVCKLEEIPLGSDGYFKEENT